MARTHTLKSDFYPGSFALVMATGILSIATAYVHRDILSWILLTADGFFYLILCWIYLRQAVLYRKAFWADLTNATRMFGFLTFVAGTNVLAARFSMLHWFVLAITMGTIAAASWFLLMYFIMYQLVFHNEVPIQSSINGSWLLTIVSTESVAAWSASVVNDLPADTFWLLFLAYACWGIGIFLYLIFIGLIMMRFFFYHTESHDVDAPYWINMGAMAIATLAGSRLVLHPDHAEFLLHIKPMIEGMTILLWAWGTWWIPFLLLVGIKKYVRSREPMRYHPSLWGMVFPIGMYTAATDHLSRIAGLSPLYDIVRVTLWIGLAAWLLVGLLFVRDKWLYLRTRKAS